MTKEGIDPPRPGPEGKAHARARRVGRTARRRATSTPLYGEQRAQVRLTVTAFDVAGNAARAPRSVVMRTGAESLALGAFAELCLRTSRDPVSDCSDGPLGVYAPDETCPKFR